MISDRKKKRRQHCKHNMSPKSISKDNDITTMESIKMGVQFIAEVQKHKHTRYAVTQIGKQFLIPFMMSC